MPADSKKKTIRKAIKYDEDKPRTDLLPANVLLQVAKILGYGAKKYNDYNYLQGDGLPHSKPFGATLRHMFAYWDGEDLDKESNAHHLDHAITELLMLKDEINRGKGKDDRKK